MVLKHNDGKSLIGRRTETFWDLLPEGPGSCPHMAEDPDRGPLQLWKRQKLNVSLCVCICDRI